MDNVQIKVNSEGILTIRIDLNNPGTPSASGKSLVIATTRGNHEIKGGGGVKLGINCFKLIPQTE